jgi:hypothetical protein
MNTAKPSADQIKWMELAREHSPKFFNLFLKYHTVDDQGRIEFDCHYALESEYNVILETDDEIHEWVGIDDNTSREDMFKLMELKLKLMETPLAKLLVENE